MTNPYIPPYEEGKELSEQPTRVLIARLNARTASMSTIHTMMELPEYVELIRRAPLVLVDIWSDADNFGHWQNISVQTIAASLGEKIEFPEEARTSVEPAFAIVKEWLNQKVESMLLAG